MATGFETYQIPNINLLPDFKRVTVLTGIAQTLAALGSIQGDAAPVVAQTSNVTGADNVKGVILPVSVAGQSRIVFNSGAAPLLVYPPTGGSIDGAAVNAPVYIDRLEMRIFIFISATVIQTLSGNSGMVTEERTFTETAGVGVYTGSVKLPPNSTVHDIIVNGVALWTAVTSAIMTVGDAGNASGFFTGVDLKATDLLAGESLSFALAGGKAGAYIANSQVSPRFSAAARTISGVVTTVGGGGGAGRTRMTVIYSVNPENAPAVKV